MAGSTAAKTATGDEAAMHSVAAAMRDAADHAAQVKQTAGEIGSSALHNCRA
jgi:hypothetical protein